MSSSTTPPPHQDDQTVVGPDRTGSARAVAGPTSSHDLVRDQKSRFGKMRFGACFFGWLTATGTAVLLTAVLAAIGAGVGSSQGYTPAQASGDLETLGLAGVIVVLAVLLVAYFSGGYVAGRMARFGGLKQGVGVWLWAVIVAVVLTVLGLIAGSRFNLPSSLSGLPALPVSGNNLTAGAIIGAVAVLVVTLVGAILGGLAGMRYHRRIDHADLSPQL
ncbi:MAG: hypothetical protein JWP61_1970 [Friedmanniella sp.]|nr:hypothetical protein [Friedmanniella sp.]